MFELSFEDVPLVEVMQCLLLGLRILESANFRDETQKIRGQDISIAPPMWRVESDTRTIFSAKFSLGIH